MLAQQSATEPVPDKKTSSTRSAPRKEITDENPARNGLSFTETHRLKELPGRIERLEEEIRRLSGLLADPGLYTRDPVKFQKATEALAERQKALGDAEEDWLDLEERATR
jgi:ATP-binding cassette subfamily F protein uup